MSVVKEYYRTDKDGKKRVQELQTGIIVEYLEEPSAEYLGKLEPEAEWQYILTSEVTVASDLPPTTIESKLFRFPRELTPIEEASLEKATGLTVKRKVRLANAS